ncbi:MAG: crosslink repair DNA glycosylase YcaQ family protein, partial [Pseudomonadota bacterium]
LFSIAEMSDWAQSARRDTRLAEVAVIGRDKAPRISLMRPTWEEDIANLPAPLPRLRILSPFDPVIRDRARLSRLFGFDYRIEVFTPAAKRVYGYYVFPILEGIRFTGRIDLKANRATSTLHIQGYWPEPGVKLGQGRMAALAAELERLMRFAGLAHLTIDPGPKTELLRAAPARLALG